MIVTYCSKCHRDIYIENDKWPKLDGALIVCHKCHYKSKVETRNNKLQKLLKPSIWKRILKLFK